MWKLVLITGLLGMNLNLRMSACGQFLETSQWRIFPSHELMSSVTVTTTRSGIDCVNLCGRLSNCSQCGYKSMTKECFLTSELTTSVPVSSDDGDFTASLTDQYCSEEDAPVVNNTFVNWTQSLTSLEGNVTCLDANFLFSKENPALYCEKGVWGSDVGECRQKMWRNLTAPMLAPVARIPSPGWSMCLRGVSQGKSRFSVNLMKKDLYLLRMDNQFYDDYNKSAYTVMDENAKGNWSVGVYHYYPGKFKPNVPFNIKITAVEKKNLTICVDEKPCAVFELTKPIHKVTHVTAEEDILVETLDIWCD